MTRLLIHHKAQVLVCDGSKALFYVNVGDAQAISLQVGKTLVEDHPPTRDLGTDKPGRSFDSAGASRSAVQQTDWHDLAEAAFLRRVAQTLDASVRVDEVKELVIVAPPRALGMLREQLSESVRGVLKAEIARDLVKMPRPKVEAFLQSESELR